MASPRPINDHDREIFAALHPREFRFTGPGEAEEGIEPAHGLVTDEDEDHTAGGGRRQVVRVPWQLEADEIKALVDGGTLWLTTWGGLPVHTLFVTFAEAAN